METEKPKPGERGPKTDDGEGPEDEFKDCQKGGCETDGEKQKERCVDHGLVFFMWFTFMEVLMTRTM